MVPCLSYSDKDMEFHMEACFSQHCLSVAFSQRYDQERRVVAYTSKLLNSVQLKFSVCENHNCYCMACGTLIRGQKIIIRTSHQFLSFLNIQQLREGQVTRQLHHGTARVWFGNYVLRIREYHYSKDWQSVNTVTVKISHAKLPLCTTWSLPSNHHF